MSGYERILVAVDGSAAARRALAEAMELATTYEGTVHALYVTDSAVDGIDIADVLDRAGTESIEDARERANGAGVDFRTVIRSGSADEEIVSYADEIDADIVIVGTHARTGFNRMLIGSVAEHVVRHASMPVLTVRADDADA